MQQFVTVTIEIPDQTERRDLRHLKPVVWAIPVLPRPLVSDEARTRGLSQRARTCLML